MRYLSVCSGIEAATCAWHPLGWTPVGFSEIEKFPCQVLAHHYPDVPNFGDLNRFKEWPDDLAPDLLVGGTPCQSFSVAGLRKGLADPRGNLALVYLALADRYRPEWLVWENVPGVLSSESGRDFGAFLGALGELGYGYAYRVLDAQYFGVAQRRRRVFVVANSRDWRRAAAVLFESKSLSWDPPPSRGQGQGIAAGSLRSTDGGSDVDHARAFQLIPEVTGALTARGARNGGQANDDVDGHKLIAFGGNNTSGSIEVTPALLAQPGSGWKGDFDSETFLVDEPVAFKASHYTRDKDGAPDSIVPPLSADADKGDQDTLVLAFDTTQVTSPTNRSNPQPGDPCHPLAAGAHPPAIAFGCKDSDPTSGIGLEISPTLRSMGHDGSHANAGGQVAVATFCADDFKLGTYEQTDVARTLTSITDHASLPLAATTMRVRRLMPVECERLQGFKDNYTLIPVSKKKMAKDGPRYKALGNSMAVPAMAWIGERIALVAAQE